MKLEITPNQYFSLASVTTKKIGIVKCIISVDTHSQNTLTKQVIEQLYPDALLSGSGTYSREEFLDAVNLLGASIDIDVTDARVSFILRTTSEALPKLLRLFAAMIQEPMFAHKELKRVKAVTLNQLQQAKEDSRAIAHEKLRNNFYGAADRKYSYSIDECIETVPRVTTTQLRKFHKQVVENNWFCSIGGEAAAVKIFATEMKKLKHDGNVSEGTHQPKPPKPNLSLENIPSRQNIDLSIGVPLPITRSHPDYIPLAFAIAVLGKVGGFAGRLMSTIREKEGLTYGIYSQLEGFASQEQGYFRITTFFSPVNTVQGLKSTFREIKKLHTHGVSHAEVDAFKTILTTQQSFVKDSFTRTLADLHNYHYEGFTVQEMHAYKRALCDVKKADINRVIKTYLDPVHMSVSGAGPVKDVQKDARNWFESVS